MCPRVFEMCSSLGDNNKFSDITNPDKTVEWLKLCAISVTFKLHHLINLPVEVFVPPAPAYISLFVCMKILQ